jgi:hypothetical protein
MAIDAALLNRLLTAVEGNRLVIICGAGLSMAPPSNLPSAATVAERCYEKRLPVEPLPAALRENIDLLAGYFHQHALFEEVFIHQLVPWNELVGQPNEGHAAIADLLICRAGHAALCANFDPLIEHWAHEHKIALRGALTGQEAIDFASTSNPLFKFHGCFDRSIEHTVWTQRQLNDEVVRARIDSFANWVNLNIPGKHLLVVGFWTDWDYLNSVLEAALENKNAASVTVVDPAAQDILQAKATQLWHTLNALSNTFTHVRESGNEFLKDLRTAFCRVWARQFYARAGIPVPQPPDTDSMSCEELYDLRRDVEGIPYNRAATIKTPPITAAQTGFFRAKALNAGAIKKGAWLEHAAKTIRIVNGAGRDTVAPTPVRRTTYFGRRTDADLPELVPVEGSDWNFIQ